MDNILTAFVKMLHVYWICVECFSYRYFFRDSISLHQTNSIAVASAVSATLLRQDKQKTQSRTWLFFKQVKESEHAYKALSCKINQFLLTKFDPLRKRFFHATNCFFSFLSYFQSPSITFATNTGRHDYRNDSKSKASKFRQKQSKTRPGKF